MLASACFESGRFLCGSKRQFALRENKLMSQPSVVDLDCEVGFRSPGRGGHREFVLARADS